MRPTGRRSAPSRRTCRTFQLERIPRAFQPKLVRAFQLKRIPGGRAGHVLAFARRREDAFALAAVPLRTLRLRAAASEGATLSARELFARLPFALLVAG